MKYCKSKCFYNIKLVLQASLFFVLFFLNISNVKSEEVGYAWCYSSNITEAVNNISSDEKVEDLNKQYHNFVQTDFSESTKENNYLFKKVAECIKDDEGKCYDANTKKFYDKYLILKKDKTYYVYEKNIIPNGKNKNCELLPCDFKLTKGCKIGNKTYYINIINNANTDEDSKELKALIDNGLLEKVGSTTSSIDETKINSYEYYKVYNESTKNEITYYEITYYKKNASEISKGTICSGYLPSCDQIGKSAAPLYNNSTTDDSNNEEARKKFYSNKTIEEENLWYINSTNDANCLAIGKNGNKDIGYCSDLIYDSGFKLKYEKGLSHDKNGNPNCYLKSCIDLTKEELEKIVEKDPNGENKYCSEYYWLETDKGFKYFPKGAEEKTDGIVYCSDLDEDNQLKFRNDVFIDKDNKNEKYSYGGGRNLTKSNCYLKNCFSLNDKERTAVINAKMTNIGFELEKYKDNFNIKDSNLPLYCDDGFLFTKGTNYFKQFDYFNLNVIPCFDFPEEKLGTIQNAKNRMIKFDKLLESYDTNNSNVFCRSHYIPINKFSDNTSHDETSNFLETTFVIADETDKVSNNTNYQNFLKTNVDEYDTYSASSNSKGYWSIFKNAREITSKTKIKFTDVTLSSSSKTSAYSNVCKYVDNSFLYHNTSIESLSSRSVGILNPKITNIIEDINGKSGCSLTEEQEKCINDAKTKYNNNHITITEYNEKLDKCSSNYNTQNCKVNGTTILENIIDCTKYKSSYTSDSDISSTYTSIFDCELFESNDSEDKKIYLNYKNGDNIYLSDEDIKTIQESCNNLAFLIDDRKEPTIDNLAYLIKPYSLSTLIKDGYKDKKYGTNDIGRYGCSTYTKPSSGYGMYGCKAPTDESSYISYNNDNEDISIVNNVSFKKESSSPDNTTISLGICSRYPSTKYATSDDKCGNREGSDYGDKCVLFDIDNSGNTVDLEKTKNMNWYFNTGSGGTRFRSEIHGRDVFIFRDFYTYYKCSSSNNTKKQDNETKALISLEATAVAGVSCITTVFLYPICITATIASIILSRSSEYQLSLQNNIHYPHEYDTTFDDYGNYGFLTRANITNNDNYIYRYYKRADNIEDDIRNKLETNIDVNDSNKRFFYGNTLSKDIIRNCKIYNLFGAVNDSNNSYSFFYLDKDGKRQVTNDANKKCTVNENETAEKCLDQEQIDCLAGYGVKFLFNSGINETFITSNGSFLKEYQNGDSIKVRYKTKNPTLNWVPLKIVPFTQYSTETNNVESEKEELKNRERCSLKKYGDAYGTLDECRGFEYENTFYTESQSVKLPLFSSPIFFYTLVTPRNVPELFNPTLYLKYFYSKNGEQIYGNNNVVLDFYEPKLQYAYDFINAVNDTNYKNTLECNNSSFDATIKENKINSCVYIAKYRSDNISEMNYNFALSKTFVKDLHNSYTPKVCLNEIGKANNATLNSKFDTSGCDGTENNETCNSIPECKDVTNESYCLQKSENQKFIIIDKEIECYDRAIPFFEDFIFTKSSNMYYNNPVINVYLKPNKLIKSKEQNSKKYSYILEDDLESNKETYILKQGGSEDVTDNAENEIQAFGLNFERSYCSKAYYDYYKYLDLLERENQKYEGKDNQKISLYKQNIDSIKNIIIPDCKQENGNENEILISDDVISPETSDGKFTVKDGTEKFTRKTAKIRQYNELYGGFNEVCLAENDINNIITVYNEQNNVNFSLPNVLVYKNTTQRKTKCVLTEKSMKNENCLVQNNVYIYCNQEEIGTKECEIKFNLDTNEAVYVKNIDCKAEFIDATIDYNDLTEEKIRKMKACFKGGFDKSGNIYKNCNKDDEDCQLKLENLALELDDKRCECQTVDENSNYNTNYFTERQITAREYGLCVDITNPIICPAVRYYDSNGDYVDNSLALGKTESEMENNPEYYEQHNWRTSEKMFGFLPVVSDYKNKNLGNAEFSSSVYCGDNEDNCIGGISNIQGECNGYWKEGESTPTAKCVATNINGITVYEYELTGESCQRYDCQSIGYNGTKTILNEQSIYANDANMFTKTEENNFYNISQTDFRSYVNNEEIDSDSIDTRGASNGFAIWEGTNRNDKKTNIDNDFVEIITSKSCITGFGPSGSNYLINKISTKLPSYTTDCNIQSDNSEEYSIQYENINKNKNDYNTVKSDYTNIVKSYKNRYCYYKTNILANTTGSNYPKRRCNQFGEWMDVEDIYNSETVNSDTYKNNFYFNDENNFWVNEYKKSGPTITTGYCERLVCDIIEDNNENYYTKELADETKKYITWKHSGGATWPRTSAPRNSSKDIINDNLSDINKNKGIKYIFDDIDEDNEYSILFRNYKFKYVKKVHGMCETEHGYYNRNTDFIGNNNFSTQLSTLKEKLGKGDKINPREEALINPDSYSAQKEPYRHCTDTGLWSGIYDSCFRACEMMDIYNTTFNETLYAGENNLLKNNKYFVENHDIKYINTKDLSEEEKEKKFQLLNLSSVTDTYNGYKMGDYLTGGATWPRSIVNINSDVETTDNSKIGKRYVYVYGTCDASHHIDNTSDIRQYIQQDINLAPKRKCYEDGTWGPVENRCILYGSCKQLNLTLRDLAEIMFMYNSGYTIEKINEYISNLPYHTIEEYYTTNKNSSVITINQNNENDKYLKNVIYQFSAKNANTKNPISYNPIIAQGIEYINTGYAQSNKYESDIENCNKDSNGAACNYAALCNTTDGNSEINAGWSLPDKNIGNYFVPETCNFENDFNENPVYLNRLSIQQKYDGESLHYAKESRLNYVFDKLYELNALNPSGYNKSYYKNNNVTTAIENESEKNINIGKQKYESYQLHYHCDNKYFYNELLDNKGNDVDGKSKYYNKNIVYECRQTEDDEGRSNERSDNWRKNKGAYAFNKYINNDKAFINAENCKIKTCGNNKYSLNWTKARVQTEPGNYGLDNSLNSESELKCEDGKAFVIKNINSVVTDKEGDKEGDKESINFYKVEKDGKFDDEFINEINKLYKAYGFVSSIKGTCKASYQKSGNINKQAVGEDTYDYHRYGEIHSNYNLTELEFCTDVTKNTCDKLSEEYIFSNEEFKEIYCVNIGCSGKDLTLKDGNIVYAEENKGEFNLENEDYSIGETVVIQSLANDYSSDKKLNKKITNIDYIYTQYVKEEDKFNQLIKICPDGQDIYNNGEINRDVHSYLSSISQNDEVTQCFNNLKDYSSIKAPNCSNGYNEIKINNKVKACVIYSDECEKSKIIKDNISSYKKETSHGKDAQKEAIEYILNNTDCKKDSFINKTKESMNKTTVEKNIAKYKLTSSVSDTETIYTLKIDSDSYDVKQIIGNEIEETVKTKIESLYDNNDDNITYCKLTKTSDGSITYALSIDDLESIMFINDYIEEYDSTYNTEYEKAKEEIIKNYRDNSEPTTIICDDENSIKFSEYYNKYYNIFYLSGFLLENYDEEKKQYINIELFNEYLLDKVMNEKNEENVTVYINTDDKTATKNNVFVRYDGDIKCNENETVCNYNYYTYNYLGESMCKSVKTTTTVKYKDENEDEEPEEEATINETDCEQKNDAIITTLENSYKKIFIDNKLDKYDDKLISCYDNITCNNTYKNYIEYLSNSGSTNSNNFKSGFFIAMQCYPNGWKVFDKSGCKKRCNEDIIKSNSDEIVLDPTGTGDWKVGIEVQNMRHSTTISTYFASHANQSCHKNKYTHHASFTLSCSDGTLEKVSAEHGSNVNGWNRWYSFPVHHCEAKTYFTTKSGDEETKNECTHEWTQSSNEKIFLCIPPEPSKADIRKSDNKSGTFDKEGISTIKYDVVRQ